MITNNNYHYQDDIIEFIIPNEYKLGEHSTPISWSLKGRSRSYIFIDIVTFAEIERLKQSVIEHPSASPERWFKTQPQYINLSNGNTIYYCASIYDVNGCNEKKCSSVIIDGIIYYVDCGINFSLHESNYTART
ncbi:MAG: hypothetical protein LBP59_19570 [Planctomycetaceae bacterium]|jgi:hypothetical protein|nr:hypothetical protein [Planctomycetaceae bacterium]